MKPDASAVIDLQREDFPFTIEALRFDNEEVIWAVTLLVPPHGERIPLFIPTLAQEEGVPVLVRTRTGQGVEVTTGPYDRELWQSNSKER